jgi:hypothetical protein
LKNILKRSFDFVISYQYFYFFLKDITVLCVMSLIVVEQQYSLDVRVLGGDFMGEG